MKQSLVHDDFVATLRHFVNNGSTEEERDLARIALSIYDLTKWHEPVIEFVNAEATRAMEARGS